MKIKTVKYSVIYVEDECIDGVYFPLYDVFKEVFILGFSICGELVNTEAFRDKKDAEDFLKIVEGYDKNR